MGRHKSRATFLRIVASNLSDILIENARNCYPTEHKIVPKKTRFLHDVSTKNRPKMPLMPP